MSQRYVTAPDHVVACDLGPATVLVNYHTGGVQTLVGPSSPWWAELAATGDTSAPTTMDSYLACLLVGRLRAAAMLVDTARPQPWPAPITGQPWRLSFGTQEAEAGWTPVSRVPFRLLALAAFVLGLVLASLHLGPARARMVRLLRVLRRAADRTVRPATPVQVCRAVDAVRRAGLLMPGRVACLEESAAVALMLAMSRHRVTWCHGVAADPIRLHAWVETDEDQAVAEPVSTLRYTALRTIPATQLTGDDHY